MNTCHPKMKFTFDKEKNNCFNFLDKKVIKEDNVFTTSVYDKHSFNSIYTHFDHWVKTFINKAFITKRSIQTAEKKQVTIALLYMVMRNYIKHLNNW